MRYDVVEHLDGNFPFNIQADTVSLSLVLNNSSTTVEMELTVVQMVYGCSYHVSHEFWNMDI